MKPCSTVVLACATLAAGCSSVPENDAPVSELLRGRGAHVLVVDVGDPPWVALDEATRSALTTRIVDRLRDAGFEASPPGTRASFVGALTLTPSVEPVVAEFFGGFARWDGVAEPIEHDDGLVDSKMDREMRRLVKFSGRVNALSLAVRIVDSEGREHYANAGGLGVLTKFDDHDPVDLDPRAVLSNPEHVERAVEAALRPLYD